MGCMNGKHSSAKNSNNADDTVPINVHNSSTTNDGQEQSTSTGAVKKRINAKQNDKAKISKTLNTNQHKKRKKKKEANKKDESSSEGGSGILRRSAQNGSLPSKPNSGQSNINNGEDEFDVSPASKSVNSGGSFSVTPDRLHKNFQERLVGQQMSKNGQKLSDSQIEFFKMLDEKIAQGDEVDDEI